MRRRPLLPLSVLLAVLAVAGCGGGGGGGGKSGQGGTSSGGGGTIAAASVIPASAPVVISIDTDAGSSQRKALTALLAKFPNQAKLLGSLEKQLGTGGITLADVDAAFGPETDVVLLDVKSSSTNASNQAIVGLTQPKDSAKLNALFAKGKSKAAHEEIGGWTVFADTQALIDRFKTAAGAGKLADSATYKEAVDSLPEDRLAGIYADGAALAKSSGSTGGTIPGVGKLHWLAGGVDATDDGIGFEVHGKADNLVVKNFGAGLHQIPGGVLAGFVFNDIQDLVAAAAKTPAAKKSLGGADSGAGALSTLLGGQGAIYIRSGSPLPEVTAALDQENPQKALSTLDGLLRKNAENPPTTVQVAGLGAVKQITVKGLGIPVYYGLVDNRLVVTTSTSGFTGAQGGGERVADDPLFKEVKAAAGMPDENAGFLYLDLKDLVPLVQNFLQISGSKVSPDTFANLAPLRALLAYAVIDGDTLTGRGFLEIK